MIAKYIVLSNMINVVSDNIAYMYSRTPVDIKKIYSSSSYFQHIAAYSFAIKFTSLIPGNVCVHAGGYENFSEVKLMKTLVFTQHHVERIL